MDRTASADLLTVIAISIISYTIANIAHEIIGHCSMAMFVGTKCKMISSTNIPLATEIATWKYKIIVLAGCTSNIITAIVCLLLLRRWTKAAVATKFFLWLTMSVNFFLASTYIAVAPIIRFGDSYILIHDLSNQLFFRVVVVLVGGVLVCFSFWICRKEFAKLIGVGGGEGRSIGIKVVVTAYIAGGLVTVTSALFSQLEAKVALLQAAGGTFGLTAWLLLLPFVVPTTDQAFELRRNVAWIVAGTLAALVFIAVLGPGVAL